MPSAWIDRRVEMRRDRFRVRYRLGGRETACHGTAASFATKSRGRRAPVCLDLGELAALPRARTSTCSTSSRQGLLRSPPTLRSRWQASRVDVSEYTGLQHRPVRPARCCRCSKKRRVDEIPRR